jgi:nucleoside 2-deoxyribosyltransferase
VLFAEHKDAFNFIAVTLQEAGLIKFDPISSEIILTARGLERIDELERNIAGKDSRQAFVAMWFDSSLDKAWEDGFEKSCDAAGGYKALRMNLKEHNQKICDAIIAEIRKSRFLVADFTGHRGGVYFEAGYALGLGIPVIWTCREDHLEKTHFDTRQYNHVVWKDEKDLFVKLKRRIEATIPA